MKDGLLKARTIVFSVTKKTSRDEQNISFFFLIKSGRQDLNLRHPAPKAGALARLSHAPDSADYTINTAEKSLREI